MNVHVTRDRRDPESPVERSRPVVLQLVSSLQVGGAERLLADFLNSAAADAATRQIVVVINDEVHAGLARSIRATGFPLVLLRRPRGRKDPRYLARLLRIILEHDVKIVHAHNAGAKFWSFACKARFPHLKLVYTVHQTGEFARSGPLHRRLHRHLVARTIAISQAVAAECAARQISGVRLIHNGVPLERFAACRRALPPSERLRLVNVARLDLAVKGQDILVRAVRACLDAGVDVGCRLIGNHATDAAASLPQLQALIDELGVAEHIEILQDRTDVAELLPDADVFVLPSRREGFGLVVVEAMAAGLPVIVADLHGPAELVEDGITGLRFAPGSHADLARQIRRLATDAGLRQRLARNADAFVQRFDIATMRAKYLALYAQALLPACGGKGQP